MRLTTKHASVHPVNALRMSAAVRVVSVGPDVGLAVLEITQPTSWVRAIVYINRRFNMAPLHILSLVLICFQYIDRRLFRQ